MKSRNRVMAGFTEERSGKIDMNEVLKRFEKQYGLGMADLLNGSVDREER